MGFCLGSRNPRSGGYTILFENAQAKMLHTNLKKLQGPGWNCGAGGATGGGEEWEEGGRKIVEIASLNPSG